MHEELREYVEKHLHLGYDEEQLRDHLLNHGWPMHDIDQAMLGLGKPSQPYHSQLPKKNRKAWIVFIVIFLVLISLLIVSYTYLSVPAVEKPLVEKPLLPVSGEAVAAQHVAYMFNELGAYQLQDELI